MCKHCKGTENVNEAAARIVAERMKTYDRKLRLLTKEQHRMRDPERTLLCDIIANGQLLPDPNGSRYGQNEAHPMTAAPTMPELANDAQRGSHCGCSDLLGHVTVIFCAKDSIYKSLVADCYDAERNALTYTGKNPVVAHPPCQLWGKMAVINHLRWGGDHNKPGNDGGCFRFALDTVNRCGGVLEHPAESYAWPAHGLPRPGFGWTRWKQGWVCEVWQSAYGHRANKRTWLYCSGTESPLHPRWERPIGTHQVGFHDQRGKAANKPTLSKREANATPPAFAHYLLELAATCAKWPNAKGDSQP